MAVVIRIPAADETTEEVRIVGWLKQVGEAIAPGDALLEVETDKAVVEVESFGAGVLLAALAEVDDTVAVGTPVAVVGEAGEDFAALLAEDAAGAPAGPAEAPAPPTPPGVERVELTAMRRSIARVMSESVAAAPHFHCFETIPVPPVRALGRDLPAEQQPTINDVFVYAAARAMAKTPELNACWGGDHIKRFAAIHVGIIVPVADGLMIPVLRDAGDKELPQIAVETKALLAKARAGRLGPEDLRDGTFTISNMAPAGPRAFTSTINPPQAAILAIGGVRMTPVADIRGRVTAVPAVEACLACDHRVADGMSAARFLAQLKQICAALRPPQ